MTIPTEEMLEELSTLGSRIYDGRLKAVLEPVHDGEFVAIHVDSGDFEVAKTSGIATRALLKRFPIDGRLFIRKIGNEPEYSLAARLLAAPQPTLSKQ
jgi:hypothetical protein